MSELRARWLPSPPAGWEALRAADPGATPAHHPALALAFAASQAGSAARFLALDRDGDLVGGMPLVVQRRAGFHWLLAMPASLPGAPLARSAAERAEVDRAAARALDHLGRELNAVGGAWVCYRPSAEPVAEEALLGVGGETRRFEASHIALASGLEQVLRRMDRKTRKEMRQAREAGLAVAEDPTALEAVYALYRSQSRAWRTHRALPLELLRRLLAPGADAPLARLFVVRDGRGPLAGLLALDSPIETMLWWSGTHRDARAAHAFPLLLWSVIEWAHGQGRARVNLGASADRDAVLAFKESMGADRYGYPVRWLDARHASLPGRAVAALQAWLRRRRPLGARV